MKYIGLNNKEVRTKYTSMITVRRDICFWLTDPGSYDTNDFLKILWTKAGGIIESVWLYSSYRNPETGEVSHTYRVVFQCKNTDSKAGLAFPVEKITSLVREIEDELEANLPIHFLSKHTLRGELV